VRHCHRVLLVASHTSGSVSMAETVISRF
jgi:hypothetical protein